MMIYRLGTHDIYAESGLRQTSLRTAELGLDRSATDALLARADRRRPRQAEFPPPRRDWTYPGLRSFGLEPGERPHSGGG